MAVTSRASLATYCKRKLGHPVIKINVDDEQVSDRIDEALQKLANEHYNGLEKTYVSHQITASDITNEYISMNDNIISVVDVFPITRRSGIETYFNPEYQMMLSDISQFSSGGLTHIYMSKRHFNLIGNVINSQTSIRYNRYIDKLHLDVDWSKKFEADDYIIIECYRIVDPETYTDLYDDEWLKKYTTALIKEQWGSNLKKFGNVQMPGNIELNGQQIFEEARQEIEKLEEDLELKYTGTPQFFIG